MTMDRAYSNPDEGFVCCCWNAPSKDELENLFKKAGAPFERIVPVSEFASSAFG